MAHNLSRICAITAAMIALPALLVGCGGGSSNVTADGTAATGRAAIQVQFPGTSRSASVPQVSRASVPYGTKAVRVVVTDSVSGAALAAPLIIAAPTGGFGQTTTGTFTALPARTIRITATAHFDTAATSVPIASGSTTALVAANATTSVTVPITLTADHLSVTPTSVSLTAGSTTAGTQTLTVQILDAGSHALLVPLIYSIANVSIATVAYDSNNAGTATITGVNTGTTTLTVTEPSSGLTTNVTVTVN